MAARRAPRVVRVHRPRARALPLARGESHRPGPRRRRPRARGARARAGSLLRRPGHARLGARGAGGSVSQPAPRHRARAPRARRAPARARGVRTGLCERRESDRHRGPDRLVHARLAVPEPPHLGTAARRLAASGPAAVADAARVVMIRFSLLHPSRGRLERAAQAIGEWTARRSGDHSVEHILSVDTDDDVAGYRRVADATGVRLVVNENRSIVDAVNAAARASSGEVLIVVSDDFVCPAGWDRELGYGGGGRRGIAWL